MEGVKLSGTSVSIHINTPEMTVRKHCTHSDEQISLSVLGTEPHTWETPSVYLTGTPAELRRFARQITAAIK